MATPKKFIALITGANQGVGYETARKLAKEHLDFHVLMGSRNPERGEEAAAKLRAENLSVEAITIDILSDASINEAFKTVNSKFGRLDVLISNAGIAKDEKYIQSGPSRDLMLETFNTNLFGAIQTFETFSPLLQKSKLPRVVFVTTSLGSFSRGEKSPGNFAVYRSSKSALNMMVKTLVEQDRFKGWKINLTCPGHVATNLNSFGAKGNAEDGATNAVRLATLGEDGETGTLSDRNGPFGW